MNIHTSLCVSSARKKGVEICREGTDDGRQRILTVASEQRKLRDLSCAIVLERIANISETTWNTEKLKWHKNCYSSFTAESKLKRLCDKASKSSVSVVLSEDQEPVERTSRSHDAT